MFTHIADSLRPIELFIDISFLIDIILNFFTLAPNCDTTMAEEQYNESLNLQQLLYPSLHDRGRFYKGNDVDTLLKKSQLKYLRRFFILDCIATIPGIVTLEQGPIFYFKLVRLVHWDRLFIQLNLIFEKVLLSWLVYNRHKVR